MHRVDYFLNIAQSCGIEAQGRDYEFFPCPKDRDYIQDLLEDCAVKKDEFLVVINPGGNWELKRWPRENFAQLSDQLIQRYQARVIITGALKDMPLARDIAARMKHKPLIFCGKTSLGQLAALMARVDLVIANDSGPMHIAVSQGAKVIALFGPTSVEITGPCGQGQSVVIQKDVHCLLPCYKLDCRRNRCMEAISVEEVLRAAERLGINKVLAKKDEDR